MAKFNFVLGQLPDFKLPVTFTMPNGEDATIILPCATFPVKKYRICTLNREK